MSRSDEGLQWWIQTVFAVSMMLTVIAKHLMNSDSLSKCKTEKEQGINFGMEFKWNWNRLHSKMKMFTPITSSKPVQLSLLKVSWCRQGKSSRWYFVYLQKNVSFFTNIFANFVYLQKTKKAIQKTRISFTYVKTIQVKKNQTED